MNIFIKKSIKYLTSKTIELANCIYKKSSTCIPKVVEFPNFIWEKKRTDSLKLKLHGYNYKEMKPKLNKYVDKFSLDLMKKLIAFSFIFIIFCVSFLYLRNKAYFVDEYPHITQIQRFLDFFENPNFENQKINLLNMSKHKIKLSYSKEHGSKKNTDILILQEITNFPGYHFFYATLCKILNFHTVKTIRFVNMIFSFFSVIVFYLIIKKIKTYNQTPLNKTFQYAFLPTIYVFFFIIYTDVLCIFLTLLSFLLSLNKKYFTSAVFIILSIIVRQSNIVWLIFILFYNYLDDYDFYISKKTIKESTIKYFPFLFGIALFIIFVFLNKGAVTVGDRSHHPSFFISFDNVYYALFLFFFIFLPINLKNIHNAIKRQIKFFINLSHQSKFFNEDKIIESANCQKLKNKLNSVYSKKILKTLFIFLFSFIFIFIFILTFKGNHDYNKIGLNVFLRNNIIVTMKKATYYEVIFAIIMILSIYSIFKTKLHDRKQYLIYVFAILSLIPFWLIETRYSLISFIFFNIFRKEYSKKTEIILVLFFIILSISSLLLIVNKKFFW